MHFLKLALVATATMASSALAAPAADAALAARAADALATVERLLTFTRREAVSAMKAAVEKRTASEDISQVLGYKKRDADASAKASEDISQVLGYKREAEAEDESGFNVNSILDYCASS